MLNGNCGKNLFKAHCNYSSWEFGQDIGVNTPTSSEVYSLFFLMTLSDEKLGFLSQQNDTTSSSTDFLQQHEGAGSELTQRSDGA